ncbi:MAG: 50S ribosomal protein L30 [Bacteroidota bacterium]|nr:50S ribosomal protein L30 [Bacteroidota bacterium]
MKKAKITQIRSAIGQTKRQKNTLIALGLKKMNQTKEVTLTPQIEGMIDKMKHVLKVEEV